MERRFMTKRKKAVRQHDLERNKPMHIISYKNFEEYMRLRGYTYKKIAKALEITSLSYYTTSGQILPGHYIAQIRDMLGMTAEEMNWLLLDGEEPSRSGSKYERLGRNLIEILSEVHDG